MTKFDPYQRWLGIPPQDQPPHFYRLLGLELFEDDPEVIKVAAENAIAFIQQNAFGEELQQSQKLLENIEKVSAYLLSPPHKAKYDKKLKAKLGIATSEIDTTEKQIQQANHKQRPLQSQMPENSQAIQVESPSITSSLQTRKDQSQLKLLGLQFSSRWAIVGIVSLLSLTIMFYALFMGGREESNPQSQVAATKQPAKPETNPVQVSQETKAQQQNSARENKKQAKKQMQAIVEPKAEIPSAAKAFTGQFTVRADSIKKEMGKQLEDVTVDVIYQPGRDKNERVVLGTIKTDDKGQGQLEVKLSPKEQTGRFLVKLTKDNESWERRLDGFPNELSHTLTIPVAVEPEYLNPEWLEQRLEQVGLDKLIEEYRSVDDPNVQAVYSALDLSRHILQDHPEALREQLQARLLNRQEPALAAFQVLPNQRIQFRTEWLTLGQIGGSLLRTIKQKTNYDNCVVILPNGKQAISDSGRELKLWDIESGQQIRTFQGHTRSVDCIAITPDGKQVISGSTDKTLKLWNIASGELIRTLKGHENPIDCVTVTPDGKQVISGSEDKSLRLWNLADGKLIRRFNGHSSGVKCVTVSPNGKQIISGSRTELKIWKLKSRQAIGTLNAGDSSSFHCFVLASDGKKIIAGSYGNLEIWDLSTGKQIQSFKGHSGEIESIALSSNGKQLLSGGTDKVLKLWNLESGNLIRKFQGHTKQIHCVALSPNGKYAISGSTDETQKVWDIETSKSILMHEKHSGIVRCIAVSPDGQQVLSASEDQTIKLWNIKKGTLIHTLKGTKHITDVEFMPNGEYAISSSYDQLNAWDLTSGTLIRSLNIDHRNTISCIALTPDGKQAIAGTYDRSTGSGENLKVWDFAKREKPILTLRGHSKKGDGFSHVRCVAALPNGKQAISGSDDHTLILWNLVDGKIIRSFKGHSRGVNCVAVLPDGKRAISGSGDRTLKLWDLTNGKNIRTFKGQPSPVELVAVSPDGKLTVSSYQDKLLYLWDIDQGKLIATHCLDDLVQDYAFGSDSRTLIVGGYSGYVHKLLIQMPGEAQNPPTPTPVIMATQDAKSQQVEEAKKLNQEINIKNSLGMEFALIPRGEFLMGSSKSEVVSAKQFKLYDDDHSDEFPQHRVQISKSFYMGVHEVSYEQFQKFVKMTGYMTDVERTRKGGFGWNESTETFVSVSPKFSWRDSGWRSTRYHPVLNVTWNDAKAFCTWLSRQEGVKYRLPTEAEWEYACRAGTNTLYYYGNDPKKLSEIGNIWDGTAKETFKANYPEVTGILTEDGFAFTSPVGNYRANKWGLFDMHGNVSEWCSDFYDENYYDQFAGKPAIDPQGPQSGSTHVVRGGSWYLFPEYVRSAYRSKLPPTSCGDNVGFRVVRELE